MFYVHDVCVTAEIAEFAGEGALGLHWAWREKAVHVVVKGAGGSGAAERRLELSVVDGEEPVSTRAVTLTIRGGDELALAVRDGWAYVTQNGELVAEASLGMAGLVEARSDREDGKAPCEVYLTAENSRVEVSRLALHRDVYYGDLGVGGGPLRRSVKLGAEEYYVLGDNSDVSYDSRYWERNDPSLEGKVQVGAVPTDSIVGVARWIYWPASRWRELK